LVFDYYKNTARADNLDHFEFENIARNIGGIEPPLLRLIIGEFESKGYEISVGVQGRNDDAIQL